MNENKWLFFVIMAITMLFAYGTKTRNNKKRCIQIVTLVLTCFAGLRSWRMGDCFHYCSAFLETNLPDWTLTFSELGAAVGLQRDGDTVGLELFYRVMGQLGFGFEACIFVIAAFVAISLGVLVYRYSPSPFWSYTMYLGMGFYLFSMNCLKQSIAMSFLIYAMISIIERRPGRFLLWVWVAMLFHTPALIFIVAYPFANKKVDQLYFLIIFGMVMGIFSFRDQIVDLATSVYYEEGTVFEATKALGGKTVLMVLYLILAMILRPLRRHDKLYCQVFNLMVLAALVQSFSVYENVFTRLAEYYYQFVVLFVPLMVQPAREQAMRYPDHIQQIRYFPPKFLMLVQLCMVAFVSYFYISNINGSYALLKDFKFIWEVEEASSLELLAQRLLGY